MNQKTCARLAKTEQELLRAMWITQGIWLGLAGAVILLTLVLARSRKYIQLG